MKTLFSVSAAAVLAVALVGCGQSSSSGHDDHSHGHAHSAKMGGQLVEVGDHQFNLELLRDPAAGMLTLWLLDAHAENFVRVPNESFTAVLNVGGREETLVLKAAANPATGERVGETAQFEAQADWLKTTNMLTGRLPELNLRGTVFTNVLFVLEK